MKINSPALFDKAHNSKLIIKKGLCDCCKSQNKKKITTLTKLSLLIYTEIINHYYLHKVCFLMSLLLSNQFHLCPPCACLHPFPTPFSTSPQSRSLCLVPYLTNDHHVQ